MPTGQDPAAPGFHDLSSAVGNRIREVRTGRGISLSALAVSTGLGKGTLSELERGLRNATLDTLFAVTTALAIPLSDLLVTDGDIATTHRPHGQSVDAELIGRWTEADETVEVYRLTISKGRRDSQPHAPGVLETVTVLNGSVEIGAPDHPSRLVAGQSHTFAGDREHIYQGLTEHSGAVLVMRYPA